MLSGGVFGRVCSVKRYRMLATLDGERAWLEAARQDGTAYLCDDAEEALTLPWVQAVSLACFLESGSQMQFEEVSLA